MSFYAVLKDNALEDGISREIKGRKAFHVVKFLNQAYIPMDEFTLTGNYDIYKGDSEGYIDGTVEFKSTGGKSRKYKRSRKHKTKKNRF